MLAIIINKKLTVRAVFGILILSLTCFLPAGCAKSGPAREVEWDKTFGGPNNDTGFSVQQTQDGGYVILGNTRSYGAGEEDIWLIKTDPEGNETWNKTLGGIDSDWGYSMQKTSDGGYIITGSTDSYGAGLSDVWLIKTDFEGNEVWNKTFGGIDNDSGRLVQQTPDGGYIIFGNTRSYGAGDEDIWLIKTDAEGNESWNKTFGDTDNNGVKSVKQTSDGGYIIAGETGPSEFFGNPDDFMNEIWLIKTDSSGNLEWDKTFHSSNDNVCGSVQQTDDGGYIIVGETRSFMGMKSRLWLIKTDSYGNREWENKFSDSDSNSGSSVQQTEDGGYIVVGMVYSYDTDNEDLWLIKLEPATEE